MKKVLDFAKRNWWVFLVFAVVCALWGAAWFLITHFVPSNASAPYSDRGQFGDMFGAVNALFAGLAFAGVICALVLQQRESKSQHEESEFSRNQSIQQTRLFREQLELMRQSLSFEQQKQEVAAQKEKQSLQPVFHFGKAQCFIRAWNIGITNSGGGINNVTIESGNCAGTIAGLRGSTFESGAHGELRFLLGQTQNLDELKFTIRYWDNRGEKGSQSFVCKINQQPERA